MITADSLLTEARLTTDALMEEWAERLASQVDGRDGPAIAYALRSPGKRVRAALVLAAFRSMGRASPDIAGVAAAVETVHTYSLVHDDLPCMDNDDLRRGRPTTHRAFDVLTATRVGYLLVPAAALVLARAARALNLKTETLGRMAETLFQAGGIEGMVGGQWLDLEAEQRALNLGELTAVHRGKTGALIRAACELGGMAAEADPERVEALSAYGEEIGLAFQVADDVLDVTATSDELGKTSGRDEVLQKSTFVRLMGVDAARREAARLAEAAVGHLERAGIPAESLATLANYIATRTS
ncbi:MAG: polyprenyl synthetase family protein [Gemmatimonadota bacterium]